jgi:outer membrane protein OmpA-like peptidoglycan-associated protein
MAPNGLDTKIRAKLSKLLSSSLIVSLLPLVVLGNLVGSSSAAHANLVVDAANASFAFTSKTNIIGDGKANNDVVRFNNVITVSGISIDAVVKTSIVNTGTAGQNLQITSYDPASGAGAANFLDLSVDAISGSNFKGYVNLNYTFYESGTYTGANTGSQVTFQNVSVYSLDIDSDFQFTDFRGFQKYYVNSGTALRIGAGITDSAWDTTAPYVRFLSGDGASGNNDPDDAVMVEYLTMTSLDARVGNAVADGNAYFAIGFGVLAGLGSGGPVNNPVNAAPISTDDGIYVPTTGNYILEKSHFGNYEDDDNNPFDKVQITALPNSGTLQKLVSGSWTNVSVNDYISISAIEAGELRLVMNSTAGTADTNMKFKVNDSLANSALAYTLQLDVVPTPQTINFSNPGTRALNTTVTDTITASSGLTVALTSSTTGICTITSLTIVNTGTAGACTVTARQVGTTTYAEAPSVTQTFYFSAKTAQTITYATPTDKTLSSGTYTDVATASSSLTVTLSSLTPSTCTVSSFVVTLVAAGTCQLRASQAGDSTYAPASPITRSFNISAGTAQTITFAQPSNKFVAETFASGATASSGLTVSLTSSTTSICTVSGLDITTVAAGTCTIVAAQAGDSTYSAATSVSRTFTVTIRPAPAVVTYRVEFDSNSGTGTMTSQSGPAFGLVNVNANTLKNVGFAFDGWNTRADGTGTTVADKGLLRLSNNVIVLYAQWKAVRTKPTITWATPLAIQEGTPLGNTQLNALASVPGTYTYSPAAPTALPVGKHALKVTFVPTDPKFETVELTVEIEVLAKAKITWANPASIVEGTPLSGTQLSATGTVPGVFTYVPATGTVLAVGRQTLRVTLTPTDARLSPVTADVVIDVTGKPAVVPGAPVAPTYSVTGRPVTTINWGAVANATSYAVTVDGKSACSVATLTCDVARLLGPKNIVNVTSIADGGKASAAVKATYSVPASPQVLTVVNFDTARAVIKSAEAKKLRAFASQINAAGFTTLTVFGHTDSVGGVDNQKLSIARANSTIAYLKRLLPNVKFVRSGFAAETPVADNSTVKGKAANRRAEVFIP